MATSRKSKATTARRVPSRKVNDIGSQEVEILEEVDGDYVSKAAYLAVKTAFNDMKQKYMHTVNEKRKLQEQNQAFKQEIKVLKSKLISNSTIEKENELLKEKVELSFQAYNEKYKESENLKEELKTIKNEEGNKSEDTGEEHQDGVVEKEEKATQTKAIFASVKENKPAGEDSFTQAPEEKTDEVLYVSASKQYKLLQRCGLEIVLENNKEYLILSNRDSLKQWFENETDGKVSVAFEKTPVFERFVQTDEVDTEHETREKEKVHSKECQENNERIIIQLKSKIVDQASVIKSFQEQCGTVFTSSVKAQKQDSFTQAPEEKTDEVLYVSASKQYKLLQHCGLEIVLENNKEYLILSNRDSLKQWLENETDGKVSVAFEKTPVFERFVQTDEVDAEHETREKEKVYSKECQEINERIIIQLKSKIVDQANVIKTYREQLGNMVQLVNNSKQKMVDTSSVMVQTQGTFHDEQFFNKQVQLFARYHASIKKKILEADQKTSQLHKELKLQKSFTERLLSIISDSMHVPDKLISSILSAAGGKSSTTREIKKPPSIRAVSEDKSLEHQSKAHSPPGSIDSLNEPILSMPVQETDRRLRIKIAKPKDPDYDPALDEGASASGVSASGGARNRHVLVTDNIPSSTREVVSSQASGSGHDSDDIEVIDDEETGAAGGDGSGAKQCPLCFMLCTPGTSQEEFENHVMGHFPENDAG